MFHQRKKESFKVDKHIVSAPAISKGLTKYKTLDHINSYPLVQQTKEALGTLAVTKIFVANINPIISSKAVHKTLVVIDPITKTVDTLSDKTLVTLEKIIPSLKTKTYQKLGDEVMAPCKFITGTSSKVTIEVLDFTETKVYEPCNRQVLKFRHFYNEKVYDTHGRPLVRGALDPIVAPCNKNLERLTKNYLPKGKEVPTDGFTNELTRSAFLIFNIFERLLPVVGKKVQDIVVAPCKYTLHVNDVFNKNLEKQLSLSIVDSFKATKCTVIDLEKECIQLMKEKNPLKKPKSERGIVVN
ncbi:related to Sporulation-specific protein 4 [Saccharomycodes ludwigii]|uniref:Related to Sporulation-specific protein 4 n=1 Tax=Saccharomycodes ludwigii TaxID=36035 RepID=A0A376B800_9ASCO|nr:hypothetical protein SCDLUD_000727 [Saccharomycodes ludwigii]KAH3903115.1 hypothetical protein SCDLUD_000727 [Saccharomycodes ludwigii]SSD60817.1 related to Sporulation-specific protein 4 [Saccharomycodes ludwigii]